MKIAFCTSAMNRRWQLERTLDANLWTLRGTRAFLALCDFNSGDDLPALVREHESAIRDGTLLYFRTEEPRHFHASKAKNTAHRLALRRRPDVLFNLDADNFISADNLDTIQRLFAREPRLCLHNTTRENGDGTAGRIAMTPRDWRRLGGYDETMLPMAWQDFDLLFRARALGLRYVLVTTGIPHAVGNAIEQKVADLEPFEAAGSPAQRYNFMHQRNLFHALSRPIRLPVAAQQRYRGRLNFGRALTL